VSVVERVALVGPGRAGVSVARALKEAGLAIVGVSGGGDDSRAAARAELGPIPDFELDAVPSEATLVILAAQDDRLDAVASALRGETTPTTLVVHLSGARGLDVFDSCGLRGASFGAFHPLRSFATRERGRGGLLGAAVAIEAARPSDRDRLFDLARAIGGAPFALKTKARALYHAAAALAGNAPLALLDVAERAFVAAGAPPEIARGALGSLLRAAVEQAEKTGAAAALTGPVVRGDSAVVARHLAAFSERDPEEGALYALLCRALVRLASRRDDGGKAAAILALLDDAERPR
jgi:predicted short-subunit dehydrogenase-like oxidoreductase (DUF2520 family)